MQSLFGGRRRSRSGKIHGEIQENKMNLFDIINIPLGYIIRWSYSLTNNYAVALLFFALAMQIILLPFAIKQQKNSVKQASLRPKEMAIRKKYSGRDDKVTQQKMQEELYKMYQDEHFNPMGGCLPLLIQMPILMALYQVVINPLRYITMLSVDQIELLKTALVERAGFEAAARNLQIDMVRAITNFGVEKLYDVVPELSGAVIPNFTAFGGAFDLSQVPTLTSILVIIPILSLVTMFLSTKITKKFSYNPAAEAQQRNMSMVIMELSGPLLSFYIAFQVAAAVGLYWIFRSVLMVVQQIILSRVYKIPQFSEEEYKEAEKAIGKMPKEKKQKVRSLHRIDDDEDDEPEQQSLPEAEKPMLSPAPAPLKKDDRKRNEVKTTTTPEESPPDDPDTIETTEYTESEPEKKKTTPDSGKKYNKTGNNYKKK